MSMRYTLRSEDRHMDSPLEVAIGVARHMPFASPLGHPMRNEWRCSCPVAYGRGECTVGGFTNCHGHSGTPSSVRLLLLKSDCCCHPGQGFTQVCS